MAKRKPPATPTFDDEPRQPWERQPKESDAAWRCFQLYRDLPHLPKDDDPKPRSQREVATRLYPGRSPTATRTKEIGTWSAKWDWVVRANAYDTHIDRIEREAFMAALKRDTDVNLAAYRTMRNKGANALAQHQGGIAPQHAARMVDTAITGLRREAGLATEIHGTEAGDAFISWLTTGDDPGDDPLLDPDTEAFHDPDDDEPIRPARPRSRSKAKPRPR